MQNEPASHKVINQINRINSSGTKNNKVACAEVIANKTKLDLKDQLKNLHSG